MVSFHAIAVIGTLFLIGTGLDWIYLVFVLNVVPSTLLFVADLFGFVLPILLIVVSLSVLLVSRKKLYRMYAEATLYAILLGFSLSTIIKAFTGRTSPPHRHRGEDLVLIDNSNGFDFGFMNHHVIGGWPSSHATIAFALAVTLALILPKRWYIQTILFGIALFIGIGVTFGFHWLSEFVAGTCLGTAIGLVVGRYYRGMIYA
jgi:membrane-associated phospholipid phosphatase